MMGQQMDAFDSLDTQLINCCEGAGEIRDVNVSTDSNLSRTVYDEVEQQTEVNAEVEVKNEIKFKDEVDVIDETNDEIQIIAPPPKPVPIIVDLEVDIETQAIEAVGGVSRLGLSSAYNVISDMDSDEGGDTQPISRRRLYASDDDANLSTNQIHQGSSVISSDAECQPHNSVSRLTILCHRVVSDNIELYTTFSPLISFTVLQPALFRLTVPQLERIELHNPHFKEHTAYIWRNHCIQKSSPIYPVKSNLETWRDVYNKLVNEADSHHLHHHNTEPPTVGMGGNQSNQPSTSSSSANASVNATMVNNRSSTNGRLNGNSNNSASARNGKQTSPRNQPSNKSRDIPVITISSDSPPPSPPPSAPYTALGRSISNEVINIQESCYREIRECVNNRCKGKYQVPSDNTLTMISIEMPTTWTEMEKIPGMSARTRFIYWNYILKITKRYRQEKFTFYKTCNFPMTLQEARDVCSSPKKPNTRSRKKTKPKENGAGKRKQSKVVDSITSSEDEAIQSDPPSSDPSTPPPKRSRRAKPSRAD